MPNFLLKEDEGYLLQETGDKIILDETTTSTSTSTSTTSTSTSTTSTSTSTTSTSSSSSSTSTSTTITWPYPFAIDHINDMNKISFEIDKYTNKFGIDSTIKIKSFAVDRKNE